MEQIINTAKPACLMAFLLALATSPLSSGAEPILLHEAVAAGMVKARITGLGGSTGDTIEISVRRQTSENLRLTLASGTVFKSRRGQVQNMAGAAIKGKRVTATSYTPSSEISLTDDSEHVYIVEAYCMDFHKDNPDERDLFEISPPDERIASLFRAGKETLANNGVIQAALWMDRDKASGKEIQARFPVDDTDVESARRMLQRLNATLRENATARPALKSGESHFSAKAGLVIARKQLPVSNSRIPLVFIRMNSTTLQTDAEGRVATVKIASWMFGFQNPSTLEVTGVVVESDGTTKLEKGISPDRLVSMSEAFATDIEEAIRAVETLEPAKKVDLLELIGQKSKVALQLGIWDIKTKETVRSRFVWVIPVWDKKHKLGDNEAPGIALIDAETGVSELVPPDCTLQSAIQRGNIASVKVQENDASSAKIMAPAAVVEVIRKWDKDIWFFTPTDAPISSMDQLKPEVTAFWGIEHFERMQELFTGLGQKSALGSRVMGDGAYNDAVPKPLLYVTSSRFAKNLNGATRVEFIAADLGRTRSSNVSTEKKVSEQTGVKALRVSVGRVIRRDDYFVVVAKISRPFVEKEIHFNNRSAALLFPDSSRIFARGLIGEDNRLLLFGSEQNDWYFDADSLSANIPKGASFSRGDTLFGSEGGLKVRGKEIEAWFVFDPIKGAASSFQFLDLPLVALSLPQNDPSESGLTGTPPGISLPVELPPMPVTNLIRITKVIEANENGVTSMAISPNSTVLAVGSHTWVQVVDPLTGESKKTLGEHSFWVYSLAFSPDGKLLAASGHTGDVILWDVKTWSKLATLRTGNHDGIKSLAFTPDGRRLASGSWRNDTAVIWDVRSGQVERTLKVSPESRGIQSVAFSPDGKALALGTEDRSILIWDTTAWRRLQALAGYEASEGERTISFSPDGKTFATGGKNSIILWNTASWEKARSLEHSSLRSNARSLAFSPNGRLLAAWYGRSLLLFDTGTWRCIKVLDRFDDAYSIAFSPNSQFLAAGERKRTLIVDTGLFLTLSDSESKQIRNALEKERDDAIRGLLTKSEFETTKEYEARIANVTNQVEGIKQSYETKLKNIEGQSTPGLDGAKARLYPFSLPLQLGKYDADRGGFETDVLGNQTFISVPRDEARKVRQSQKDLYLNANLRYYDGERVEFANARLAERGF